MRSTFTGLELAKRGLAAHQAALTTTGHNISNADTAGYSRQIVNLVASRPIEAVGMMSSSAAGQLGMGVDVESIKRIRDEFLDQQFRSENKSLGEWSVRKDTLTMLEVIINEPSETGMRQVLDNFWNSWQELSKQPDNLESRAVVKESALAMTDAFNHAAVKLNDLSHSLTDNINIKISEVNTNIQQIARLNDEIFRIEGLGNNANDLRDQRDLLVDNLSHIINIDVQEEAAGYTIRMGNEILVEGENSSAFNLTTVNNAFTSGDLNSGQIHGLIISRDVYVENYKNQLNSMVNMMVEAVNDMHQQGYILKDPPELGGVFFEVDTAANAAETFKLSDAIVNNVENIATSMRTYIDELGNEKVVRGNNELALAMADMQNTKFAFDTTGFENVILTGGTFNEYIRAIVSEIGVQSQEAQRQEINQTILVEQVNNRRASVSGVSLDEEVANMIKYQHAYNASARVMTTYDEMLNKIINGMGIVGR